MIAIALAIYALLGLCFIVALAFAASAPVPKQNKEIELKTDLQAKPVHRHLDEAA